MSELLTDDSDGLGVNEATHIFHWNLPVELTASILSCLDGEKTRNDITACSTVCRLWNELTRAVLFSKLEICVSVTAQEYDPSDAIPIPLVLLTKRLEETASSIVPYVKKLVLFQQTADDYAPEPSLSDREMVDAALLLSALEHFPALKHVWLHDFILSSPPDMTVIRPLDLDEVQYVIDSRYLESIPANQFMWMLGLFGSVGNLHVTGMGYRTNDMYDPHEFALPALRVRSFTSGVTEIIESFMTVLSHSPSAKTLESIEPECCSHDAMQQLVDIAKNSPKGLAHIGLDLSSVGDLGHGQCYENHQCLSSD